MSNHLRAFLVLCVSALGLSANTLTTPLTTVNESGLSSGGTLVLPQFNSSLGTLMGVTLNFGLGSITGNNSMSDLENNSAISITANVGYDVIFGLPTGAQYTPAASSVLTCSAPNGEIASCNPSGSFSASGLNASFDLSSDLSAFLTGPVNVPYIPGLIEQVQGSTIPASPTNLNFALNNESLTMPASITYTYTATSSGTPEPASFLLVGVGLIGASWAARARAARKKR